MKHAVLVSIIAGILAGCATTEELPPSPADEPAILTSPPAAPQESPAPPRQARPGEVPLRTGIDAYENARYGAARKSLLSALDAGLDAADQVVAHKYLAFVACARGQRTLCKKHFRSALEIDSGFTLSATEAGHPVWGKIFRDVRKEQSKPKR